MRVSPGRPDCSYLYQKVLASGARKSGSASQMPLGGPYLSPAEQDLIKNWILHGAAQ